MSASILRIDKSKLMKRAWYLFKQGYNGTFSYCMQKVWKEMKDFIAKQAKQAAAEIEYAKLQEWWATPEYKALKAADDNREKIFAADRGLKVTTGLYRL